VGLVAVGVSLLVASLAVGAVAAPEVGATGTDPSRQTLVGSQGGGPGLHSYGSVYLLEGRTTEWRAAGTDSYFDVTRLDNGSVLAGFMDSGYEECGPYAAPCTRTGFRVIDPEPTPRVVYEYSFPVRTAKNSEVHDVELLPSGEFLVTDMDRERVFTVEDGEVTWQWNASSHYEAPPDPTRVDWLHINDVDVVGEDRYLVSVRNANQLVVVERGRGVVEVINEDHDGDGEGDPSVLFEQHNPQLLSDEAVLVADSANDRVVELHRNETGDWTVAWAIYEAEDVEFSWPRDADRLPNGNTLITDSANQRIVSVNETGHTVWSTRTPQIPYEAELLPHGEPVGGETYRGEGALGVNSAEVPVLSFLLGVLQTSLPLPYWLSELQVGASLVSLTMVGCGVVLVGRR
jgi:hypothetical protein